MACQIIPVNKKPVEIHTEEFPRVINQQYNNLILYPNIDIWEEISGFILEVSEALEWSSVRYHPTFLSESATKILKILSEDRGLLFSDDVQNTDVVITETYGSMFTQVPDKKLIISLSRIDESEGSGGYVEYPWNRNGQKIWVYLQNSYKEKFELEFKHILNSSGLNYNNLVHLVMIVKNSGDILRTVLENNIPYIDRWTILDTGSTDNTMNIIMEVLAPRVKGKLFQEPFKNFRDTRNRALELAGKVCTFSVMLDDTYELRGPLKEFLYTVRSDQFADSYSLYIQSADVQYTTNRILRTQRNLRYIFKMHEVIQKDDNTNVMVPIQVSLIWDHRSEYMEQRTQERKKYDLQVLQESILEEPEEPRHVYYMAQTYNCIGETKNAYKYFLRRFYHTTEGFLQEKIDAGFEAARIAQFHLKKPWEECKLLYEKCFELDQKRPDSLYFIGIHYYTAGNPSEALIWFRKAFQIGYPIDSQFGLKPTLSFYFLPKLLAGICIESKKKEDWQLAYAACELFLQNPTPRTVETPDITSMMTNWLGIYRNLIKIPSTPITVTIPKKPILVFIADGNWNPWTGRDIETKGMGGSETHVVRFASCIQSRGIFDVIVFCKCSIEEKYQDVQYLDIDKYHNFIFSTKIHTVVISRFTEYIPVTCLSQAENIYVFFHDLIPHETILYRNPKIKNIFCLSEWHKQHFDSIFPSWSDISKSLHYGMDQLDLPNLSESELDEPVRFIYSSFANRGLLVLLEMWRDIRSVFPTAVLDIFCDINHQWTNRFYPVVCLKIKSLLHDLANEGIRYHGWVDKKTLYRGWQRADIWLYPCTFQETFCLTALEAARTKTLAISPDLAALRDTVGDRGFMISGDPNTREWRQEALKILREIATYKVSQQVQTLIQRNYAWSLEHTWLNQANIFLDKHVLKNPWEYDSKFNWTCIDVLNYIVPHILQKEVKPDFPHILEINPLSGTSVIKLEKIFTRGHPYIFVCGRVLDCFARNQKISRITCQIFLHDTALIDLYRDQNFFHLISFFYDTDATPMENYSTLSNAGWLLHKPGILLLSDVPADFELTRNIKSLKEVYATTDRKFIMLKKF